MTNVNLRHSISGETATFTEDYAESLLNDPQLGQYLEVVEDEVPCFDCPSQDETGAEIAVFGEPDIDPGDEDLEIYDTFAGRTDEKEV